ncbi:DUF1802 family protein [Nitrososphaera sp.]|uniref:DUF1802 family protein n=1 Tax=Nitrososphaera sp. TaxID=1971748 RepID=UPI002EDB7C5C
MQALKEWAVVCRALEEGRQAVLLRKGGILEYRQGFEVKKHDKFLLFPTYEHQSTEHLQADYAGRLATVLKEQPPNNVSIMSSYAEARRVAEIKDPSKLRKLERYHVWNESYVNARMAYNPKKPMSVILVRVYNLPSPIRVDTRQEWAGCKSWIPLDIDATGRHALDDCAFAKIESEVMEVLA